MENYHVTENKYLEAIKINGLIPQRGQRSKLIGDEKNAIFYSKGMEGVIAMFFMMIERYIEYNGSEGDIHINSYNIIKKMIEERESEGRTVSDYLKDLLQSEGEIVNYTNFVRSCVDYKEFMGEGLVLKINKIIENENPSASEFYNCWTTSSISPNEMYVVTLKNAENGEFLTSKYDILNFFMSRISLEQMKNLIWNNIDSQVREEHLLWQIMSEYYKNNCNDIEKMRDCEIIEIPIINFFNEMYMD